MHYSSPIIWAAALSWRLGTIHTSPEILVPGVTEVCPKMLIRHVYGGPEHRPLHTLLLPLPGPLALYSIGLYFHHQSYPQLGVVFALAPSLQSFWSYFSTDCQYNSGHPPIWGLHLSVSYLFAFSYCSWDSQGKNTEVVCHSLLQWTTFCQNSPPRPICLGSPYTAHGCVVHVVHVVHGS